MAVVIKLVGNQVVSGIDVDVDVSDRRKCVRGCQKNKTESEVAKWDRQVRHGNSVQQHELDWRSIRD